MYACCSEFEVALPWKRVSALANKSLKTKKKLSVLEQLIERACLEKTGV